MIHSLIRGEWARLIKVHACLIKVHKGTRCLIKVHKGTRLCHPVPREIRCCLLLSEVVGS